MKIFQKSILTVLCLFSIVGFAQHLDQRIPSSAQAVVSLNGGQLFSILSIDKFNNSQFGQKITEEMKRELPVFNGLEDFGINLMDKAHFYYQVDGEISYFSVLFGLEDHTKFSSFFAKMTDLENVESWNGKTVLVESDAVIIFDEETVQFCFAEVPYAYIEENKEEFIKKYPNLETYELKRVVSKELLFTKAKENYRSPQSILINKSYKSSLDKDAVVSMWIRNYGGVMTNYYKMIYGYQFSGKRPAKTNPDLSHIGLGAMSAHLYFKNGRMQISSEMEFSDELKTRIKKIYKQKMNKSFYSYVHLNSALGYMSYSLNTENMLKEYPGLLTGMYGGMFPGYVQEMDIVADLLKTILDEKAIGELLTGNVLLVLEDISEKDVTYVTYEYDEEYNETKVTKSKKEILPDFTLIVGTKRKDLAVKLANLGVKYEALTGSSNRFKIASSSDFPLPMYLTLTDDAIILSTSDKRFNDKAKGTLGSLQKTIDKNGMIWHLDIEKIIQTIPLKEMGLSDEKGRLITKNLKSATLTSSKLKGNKIYSDFTITSPDTSKNSLQLLMDFFEEILR
ncbi:hypothetical protein MWU59_12775 [Flavobacteriaceae bacterium F08102]|nr:hypothetical protein [Flavobacteriaceae bacterium F08102]